MYECVVYLYMLLLHLSVCGVFFFFQAEDGIRDLIVTGVQTCALPIYRGFRGSEQVPSIVSPSNNRRDCRFGIHVLNQHLLLDIGIRGKENIGMPCVGIRSEERRVGKECRSRWSPYH